MATDAAPPCRFHEAAAFTYPMAPGMGGGVAAADYDGDGDIDLFLPTAAGTPDRLYRNNGDGTFEEVASQTGVASRAPGRAALWLDATGDGRLDLLVAGDYFEADGQRVSHPGPALRLYRQTAEGGRFVDVTEDAGLSDQWIRQDKAHLGGLCAGDVNRDGWLDLFVSLWGGKSRLYLGRPDGRFGPAPTGTLGESLFHWQPVMCDFDRDGWMDVYDAVDHGPNRLLLNQRNLTFRDVAAAGGADNDMNDMGVALGDYDNDGDFDLFVTNIDRPGEYSVLLRNDSEQAAGPRFTEVAREAKVHRGGWGWGCTFFDADNDGWLDLALTNGWDQQEFRFDTSKLYHNVERGELFADVSVEAGFDDKLWGSCLLAADLDRDGDLDLVQTVKETQQNAAQLRILINERESLPTHHYLVVQPSMSGPNSSAVGAVVRATLPDGQVVSRQISAGCSFLGQEPPEACFGLGTAATVSRLAVEWPDGSVSVRTSLAADQIVRMHNARPRLDLAIWREDQNTIAVQWHGGVLEEFDSLSNQNESLWKPVPAPPSPFRADSTDRSGRLFRVSNPD